MPRFTVSQLLMSTALIAITLVFSQTEGCGTRYTFIEALSFSSDDSQIAVSKLSARSSRTPMKAYKANVSRTLSWLDVTEGTRNGIIHQDFKPGNCGPAFGLWRVGRTSALCNPSNDRVAMSAFGGGDITRNVGHAKPVVQSLQHPAFNISFSRSGRLLAASGMGQLTVIDTRNDTVAMRVQVDDLMFSGACLHAFSDDELTIVVAGYSGVHVWDIATAAQTSTVIQGLERWINAIAVAPNDTLMVSTRNSVRRYDFFGNVVATPADDEGGFACVVSSDGHTLAVGGEDSVRIYDLESSKLTQAISIAGVTALALSSNGEAVAVGDNNGSVTLIDTKSGDRRWSSIPPGRYRWPWTLPVMFLVAWGLLARQLSKRAKNAGTPSS